ncbi:Ig-like domain-containing protein [Halorubrum sp. Boch-26]|uniref:Ig-like domain-containing protein n=1 Tax=Halorubrum sp. Boch-26 TaxID=2994426 RepID=UPI002468FCB5|nr:Ig-like domain-containing protein [Halorubrum sp. Boch-26]
MRFSHDRRGQSVVIGTVILFGFLIVALGIYQVQVVPTDNANIEFEHSQQVEGDFVDIRNSILTAGQTGDARSTSLKLGAAYPSRTFFVNPPPVSGSLSTTESRPVRITNVTIDAEGNAGAYWENRTNGTNEIAFDTRSLRYSPDYNELQDGPDLVYEQSLVLAEFDDTVLGRTGQTTLNSERNRIQLTALDGDLSASGVNRRSIDPDPLSESRRSLAVNATTDPLVIDIPTDVPAGKAASLETAWERRLGDAARTVTVSGGTVRIELDPSENYRLDLGKVGVGTGATAPDESDGYVTRVSGTGTAAVVEVRDRFNNPIEGAAVEVNVSGNVSTMLTDDDGRVSVTPEGSPRIEMSINDGTEEWETVVFRAGTVGSGADDDNINPTGEDQIALNDVGLNGNSVLQFQFVNQGDEDREFRAIEFTLSYRPQGNTRDTFRITGPGPRNQRVNLRGGFEDLDEPFVIPAGERQTITFTFDSNVRDDLIGISFEDDLNRRSLYISPAEGSIDQPDG